MSPGGAYFKQSEHILEICAFWALSGAPTWDVPVLFCLNSCRIFMKVLLVVRATAFIFSLISVYRSSVLTIAVFVHWNTVWIWNRWRSLPMNICRSNLMSLLITLVLQLRCFGLSKLRSSGDATKRPIYKRTHSSIYCRHLWIFLSHISVSQKLFDHHDYRLKWTKWFSIWKTFNHVEPNLSSVVKDDASCFSSAIKNLIQRPSHSTKTPLQGQADLCSLSDAEDGESEKSDPELSKRKKLAAPVVNEEFSPTSAVVAEEDIKPEFEEKLSLRSKGEKI